MFNVLLRSKNNKITDETYLRILLLKPFFIKFAWWDILWNRYICQYYIFDSNLNELLISYPQEKFHLTRLCTNNFW